jgi:hypothetical protein
MKRTTHARAFVRMGVLFLLGATVAACGTNATTGFGPSHSATPVVSPSTSATASAIASTPDPRAGWPTFSSASGELSFRYDPTWKPNQCPPNDSPLIVLGHNICGQIEPSFAIDSAPSAQAPAAADLRCDPSQPGAMSSSTTVDGVTGTKEYVDYTSAAYDNCRHPIMHAVVYSFYTGGRTYTVTYLYIPSEGADQESKVDEMVQTLRFTASSNG